jgi:hypothetical protein
MTNSAVQSLQMETTIHIGKHPVASILAVYVSPWIDGAEVRLKPEPVRLPVFQEQNDGRFLPSGFVEERVA